jgi:hypothetical protein
LLNGDSVGKIFCAPQKASFDSLFFGIFEEKIKTSIK